MGCQAKITITYDRLKKKLTVSECNLHHNHRIGETIFQHYPAARRLNKEEEQDVKEIMQLRPSKKLVRNLITHKYGKHLTLKDIHNMQTKAKEESCGNRKDAQIVLDKLTEALKVDSKAAGGVVVDENDTLAILFYQSGIMRDMFSKFPEIMFVDGTYNVNKLGMPLYCLMVEDGFGHGQNIFYAATAREDAIHLQKIVELFKSNNTDWQSVRVIIIDKDFSEYKVLREEFPDAVILYCQWHVIKALFKCLSDYDVDKSKREECRQIIRKLVYANSQDDYDKYKQQLFDSSNDALHKAFISNWDSCKSMWVTYERDQAAHFRNTTNNRLESHNQKLKDLTSRTSSLSEMFQNVLLFIQTTESESSHVAFTEEFTSRCTQDTSISGVAEVQSICTQYAADLMVEQMKLALTIEYTVQILPDATAVISYKSRSHSVSPKDGTCSCTFQQTLLMPCRHIFKYRDHCSISMFEPSLVASRWLKSYQVQVGVPSYPTNSSCDDTFHASNEVCYASISSATKLNSTLSQSQKYRKIHSLTDKLAFCASQCGMAEFREKHATLEKVLNLWENNCAFTVVPVTDCTLAIKEENLDGNDSNSINNLANDLNDDFNSVPISDDPIVTVVDVATSIDNPISTVAATVSNTVDNPAVDVDPNIDNPVVDTVDDNPAVDMDPNIDNPVVDTVDDNPAADADPNIDNPVVTVVDTVDNPAVDVNPSIDNPLDISDACSSDPISNHPIKNVYDATSAKLFDTNKLTDTVSDHQSENLVANQCIVAELGNDDRLKTTVIVYNYSACVCACM